MDRKGDGDMCSVFEATRLEGRLEGIAEGIVETGLEVGLSETDIVVKLQNKLDISLSKAQEYFQMFCNK